MNLVKLQDTKSLHRNPLHSYTLTEKSGRKIKKTISFTIVIKYLEKNLLKETEDLYAENHKTLMKEIKDDIDGKIYHVLALQELIL